MEIYVLAMAAKVVCYSFRGQSEAVPPSEAEPLRPSFSTVVTDGEMVIYSTNDLLIIISRLVSISKLQGRFRAFYTVRYVDYAKR